MTKVPLPFERLRQQGQQLAKYCADLHASAKPQPTSIHRFYSLLSETLDLEESAQLQVLDYATERLAQDDSDAVLRLGEEVQLECEMQYLQSPDKSTRATVLFAIPFTTSGRDPLMAHASNASALQDLAAGLRESDVIHFSAKCALSDRLWTLKELRDLAPGTVRQLTRDMGKAALSGETVHHTQGPTPRNGKPVKRKCDCVCPNVNLYFVLGAACVRDDVLDEVFPEMASEATERADGHDNPLSVNYAPAPTPFRADPDDESSWFHTPGEMDDGQAWEDFFISKVQAAFMMGTPISSVQGPNGFFQDMLSGQQMARRDALIKKAERVAAGPLNAHVQPLLVGAQTEAFAIYFATEGTKAKRQVVFDWPIFDEEGLIESLGELYTTLELLNIEISEPAQAARGAPAIAH